MAVDTAQPLMTFESNHHNLDEALREHGRDAILKMAAKYFGRLVSASVHFTDEGLTTRCSVTLQMGGLPQLSAEAHAKDLRIAFNRALNKIATRLRRLKREIREDKPARIDKGKLPDGSRIL